MVAVLKGGSKLRFCYQYLIEFFDLSKQCSWQSLTQVTFFLIVCVISVCAQPLHLPAERFPCGSSHLTCERWGYDACVSPDGEFYCLPCDQEYLITLCGTKKEIPGCNLYCAKLAVDKEIEKLRSKFSVELSNLQLNFSNEKADLQTGYTRDVQDLKTNCSKKQEDLQNNMRKTIEDLLTKLNISEQKAEHFENISKSLQREFNEEAGNVKTPVHETANFIVPLGVGLLGFVVVCCVCFIWFLKCRQRDKTGTDCEQSERSALMNKDGSMKESLEFSEEAERVNKTYVSDKAVQTENDKGIKAACLNGVSDANVEDERFPGDNCPGYAKLQSISPTDGAGSEKHKIAIHGNDHAYPQQTT